MYYYSMMIPTESGTYASVVIAATLCYDDGCHLRKYSRNPVRAKLTDVTTRMSRWNIVIDKMHFSGHSDPWCRAK